MQDVVLNHQHELDTTMSVSDWLTVYNAAINEYGMDMEHIIKTTRHPEKYQEEFEKYGADIDQIIQGRVQT